MTATRLPVLDSLRALCCLTVVAVHLGAYGYQPGLPHFMADMAVILFFSLSGFFMAFHYMPLRHEKHYWPRYYIRRFFRIYPVFAISALALLICAPLNVIAERLTPENALPAFTEALTLQRAHGVFWMMRIEIFFYAIYPLLAIGLGLLKSGKLRAGVAAFIWFALMFMPPQLRRELGLLGNIHFFMGGVTAAILLKERLLPPASGKPLLWLGFAVLAADIALNALGLPFFERRPYRYIYLFTPPMALMLLGLLLTPPKWLGLRPLRAVGLASYSLYLTHMFVIAALHASPLNHNLLVLLAVGLVAALFYRAIEKPSNDLGKRLAQRLK